MNYLMINLADIYRNRRQEFFKDYCVEVLFIFKYNFGYVLFKINALCHLIDCISGLMNRFLEFFSNRSKFPAVNKMFTIKSCNCYNDCNITATPIEEAQPWRFFYAQNKRGQHV